MRPITARLLGITAVAGLLALPGSAQTRPDFSGTWVMDSTRSEAAHQAEPIAPATVIISQTPTLLTIETRRGAVSQAVVYKLDGSQHVSAVGGGTATGRLQWDGGRLVTETIYEINGVPVTTHETRSLNAAGTEMEVAISVRVEHGYQWRGSNSVAGVPNYAKGKDVYLRQR